MLQFIVKWMPTTNVGLAILLKNTSQIIFKIPGQYSYE